MTEYRALLDTLHRGGVEFILVGGVAATLHGSARLTQDVHVVYDRSPQNIARLVQTLSPCRPYLRGAPVGLPFVLDEATMHAGLNFMLSTSIGDLDLFGEIHGGGGYEALLPHTVKIEVFGFTVRCLDLVTLIRVKRAAGRLQDLEALAELEALRDESERT